MKRKIQKTKNIRRAILLAVSVLSAAILPSGNCLRVSAEEPTTFYLRYVCTTCLWDEDAKDNHGNPTFEGHDSSHTYQWRRQIGTWDDNVEGREPYYLNEGDDRVKDGDIVVVLPNLPITEGFEEEEDGYALKRVKQATDQTVISINAHLSNLTINRSSAFLSTGGVDECHVLGDSYASISGNVTNAYVYDAADCTFNNNVTNLRLYNSKGRLDDANSNQKWLPNVTVGGTVDYASVSDVGGLCDEYWKFASGTFSFNEKKGLETYSGNYSTSGSTPSTVSRGTAASQNASQSDYDDVPKTGESNLIMWLAVSMTAVSILCVMGCLMVRRNRNR
ncbi:MAG: hypothetical protein K2H41_07215 [Acetatifactor sp.]|nr:hypothetical protein [Acetatifactor sp.]